MILRGKAPRFFERQTLRHTSDVEEDPPHSTLIFFQVSLGKKTPIQMIMSTQHLFATMWFTPRAPSWGKLPTGASFCCCCFPRRGSHSYKDKPKGMSLEMESQLRVPLENFCWLVTFCFGELRDGMEVD